MDFKKPFKKNSYDNNKTPRTQNTKTQSRLKIAEEFKENPDNIYIIDNVKLKKDSLYNANQIWKEKKFFTKLLKLALPFTDASYGLKDIIDKTMIKNCYFNDLLIIVNSDDFNKKIAVSSEPGRKFDGGEGEKNILKQFLNQTFGDDSENFINPYKNSFNIEFVQSDNSLIKGKAAVVLTEHNFIPDENSYKIADVAVNKLKTKSIFNNQKFFKIGKSSFCSIQADIPDIIDFTINNTSTETGHRLDIEHNPGEIDGNKTIIKINRISENNHKFENWIIDKEQSDKEKKVWIYREGEKDKGLFINIEMIHPSEKKEQIKRDIQNKNTPEPEFSSQLEPENDNNFINVSRNGVGIRLNQFKVEELYQLVPFTDKNIEDLKFNIDENGAVISKASEYKSSAEITISDNIKVLINPLNGYSLNLKNDSKRVSGFFPLQELDNGKNTIRIDPEKVPEWSSENENNRYLTSIEYAKPEIFHISGEYNVSTIGTGIYSDINTALYSRAARQIFSLINSVNDKKIKQKLISLTFQIDAKPIEEIIDAITACLESNNQDHNMVSRFKRFKDDYNYDLGKISIFNASRKHAFISENLILNIGTFPVFILKESDSGFEVINEIPGKMSLLKNSDNWCSECEKLINRAFDPNAAFEVRNKVFDREFTNCNKCESNKYMAKFENSNLICAGLKIFRFSKI